MAPQVIDDNNKYEEQRSKFDQLRPILALVTSSQIQNIKFTSSNTTPLNPHISINTDTRLSSNLQTPTPTSTNVPTTSTQNFHNTTIIDATNASVPTIPVLVHCQQQPTLTPNIQDYFDTKNPIRLFWIQTVYEQFDKNASYRVFTRPIQKSSISEDAMILKSVLTPSVKSTNKPYLWKLNIRHCINGKPMKGIFEFGTTRALTVHQDTVRFQLASCTSHGFTHRPYDCTNVFQCTFKDDPNKRIYCYLAPFYIDWYNSHYPLNYIDPKNG